MWQLYGKGKTKAQLQEAHNTPKTRVCNTCHRPKPLDCFSRTDRNDCKWCNTKYRRGLNDKTCNQAYCHGSGWTEEEDNLIKTRTRDVWTDEAMALVLKRTMQSVRGRRTRVLGLMKRAANATPKAAPKPIYDQFEWHVRPEIKSITVETKGTKITVWSKSGVPLALIWDAFMVKGLTAEDYKAWKIGVTTGV